MKLYYNIILNIDYIASENSIIIVIDIDPTYSSLL